MNSKKPLPLLLVLLAAALVFFFTRQSQPGAPVSPAQEKSPPAGIVLATQAPAGAVETVPAIARDGTYSAKDDVALYLYTYGELPGNYITKDAARALGWPGGDLRPYAPGKTIGGDRFGNYEGLLPKKSGRVYYEGDIDALGKPSRGARRIVFSNDGLIYYTDDHYESFTLLYGEE